MLDWHSSLNSSQLMRSVKQIKLLGGAYFQFESGCQSGGLFSLASNCFLLDTGATLSLRLGFVKGR